MIMHHSAPSFWQTALRNALLKNNVTRRQSPLSASFYERCANEHAEKLNGRLLSTRQSVKFTPGIFRTEKRKKPKENSK